MTRRRKLLITLLLVPVLAFVVLLVVALRPQSNMADLTDPVKLTGYEDWKPMLKGGITRDKVLRVLRQAEANFARFQLKTTMTRTHVMDGQYGKPSLPDTGSYTFVNGTTPLFRAATERYTSDSLGNKLILRKNRIAFNGKEARSLETRDRPAMSAVFAPSPYVLSYRKTTNSMLSRSFGLGTAMQYIQPTFNRRYNGNHMGEPLPMGLADHLESLPEWSVVEDSTPESIRVRIPLPNFARPPDPDMYNLVITLDVTRGANIVAHEHWYDFGGPKAFRLFATEDLTMEQINGVWATTGFKAVSYGWDKDTETRVPIDFSTIAYQWLNINEALAPTDLDLLIPPGTHVYTTPYYEQAIEEAFESIFD
jgi:hypothetical protein